MPSKTGGTLLVAAARTATLSTPVQTDLTHPGVRLFLNVTANPAGVETLTVSIEMIDPVSYATGAVLGRAITAFPAITAATNGTYVYELYPGAIETVATTNHEVQGGSLPALYRVTVTHSAGGSWTYSLGYEALL